MSRQYGDTVTVERNGEHIEVYNHVTVPQEHYVNAVNGYESFAGPIQAGDGGVGSPDAVTDRVATLVYNEFGIDIEDQDIEVIDPDADGVSVL